MGEESRGQSHCSSQDLLLVAAAGRDTGEKAVCVGRQCAPQLVQAVVGHALPHGRGDGAEERVAHLEEKGWDTKHCH